MATHGGTNAKSGRFRHIDVPAGDIAAVVTHLEMKARAETRPIQGEADFSVRTVTSPQPDWYRALYRRVGTDWIWSDRLRYDEAALTAIIQHPKVVVSALVHGGEDIGLLELDFRREKECELVFFGIVPEWVGRGAGRFMMNEAIARAWSEPIERFWVHTCTLDHPAAVDFYVRSGFTPFRRQVVIIDDPRLSGLLPRDCGPHVPVIEG